MTLLPHVTKVDVSNANSVRSALTSWKQRSDKMYSLYMKLSFINTSILEAILKAEN
jgi:hypothetical protein